MVHEIIKNIINNVSFFSNSYFIIKLFVFTSRILKFIKFN